MNKTYKLICETQFPELEVLIEQENVNADKTVKIRGPYIVTEELNGNGRKYLREVMEKAVKEYVNGYVVTGRSIGELNHPTTTEVNLDRACHKILKLEQKDNVWIGESQVLVGTPKGDLLAGLLNNGVQVGISTRGVGNITKDKVVDEYKLITADIVYEPSGPGCFMEGILESKDFMINEYGDIVEIAYIEAEAALESLPTEPSERLERIADAIAKFLNDISV